MKKRARLGGFQTATGRPTDALESILHQKWGKKRTSGTSLLGTPSTKEAFRGRGGGTELALNNGGRSAAKREPGISRKKLFRMRTSIIEAVWDLAMISSAREKETSKSRLPRSPQQNDCEAPRRTFASSHAQSHIGQGLGRKGHQNARAGPRLSQGAKQGAGLRRARGLTQNSNRGGS